MEHKCQGCGIEYKGDLIIPDELWVKISPHPVEGFKGGGLLCGKCIMEKLEAMETESFVLSVQPLSVTSNVEKEAQVWASKYEGMTVQYGDAKKLAYDSFIAGAGKRPVDENLVNFVQEAWALIYDRYSQSLEKPCPDWEVDDYIKKLYLRAKAILDAPVSKPPANLSASIVEALEKADPYVGHIKQPDGSVMRKGSWDGCVSKLRELMESNLTSMDQPEPITIDACIEWAKEHYEKIQHPDYESVDEVMVQDIIKLLEYLKGNKTAPSPDISVLIEALNKINPQNSDGTDTEWYKYYGTQVTGEGKESYVHSASCYLACKMAEQELFKNIKQALSQYNNNKGKEEKP